MNGLRRSMSIISIVLSTFRLDISTITWDNHQARSARTLLVSLFSLSLPGSLLLTIFLVGITMKELNRTVFRSLEFLPANMNVLADKMKSKVDSLEELKQIVEEMAKRLDDSEKLVRDVKQLGGEVKSLSRSSLSARVVLLEAKVEELQEEEGKMKERLVNLDSESLACREFRAKVGLTSILLLLR